MATEKEKVLIAACKLGRNLLENGGEIYRVEESIAFFLNAYGIEKPQIFAIPASIMVSIEEDGKPVTRIERVKKQEQNLDRLDKFNNLCRTACKESRSIDYINEEMARINLQPPYSFILNLLAFGVGAGFFCLFWGGSLLDGIAAAFCGMATKYVLTFMNKFKSNIFFANLVASAVIAFIAIALVSVGFAHNYDKIIIGTIMHLVPGVAITNVMRDIIAGDLITGTVKLSEVLLVGTAIAIGIAIAISAAAMLGGITI